MSACYGWGEFWTTAAQVSISAALLIVGLPTLVAIAFRAWARITFR